MSSLRDRKHYSKLLSAKGATGYSVAVEVTDFRHCVFELCTAGNATLTVKILGAVGDTPPDFTSAQSITNQWNYIQTVDLQDGSSIPGDTGFVYSGTDSAHLGEANINALDYICFQVSSWAQGTVTLSMTVTTN